MSEVTVNRQIKMDNVRILRVSLTKPYIGKDAKVDPATGKQQVGATFKINDNYQFVADLGLEGDLRGRLQYLIRFR